VDVSYLNSAASFNNPFSVPEGASRFIARWEICESMNEMDV
jgi:hypothetical protein